MALVTGGRSNSIRRPLPCGVAALFNLADRNRPLDPKSRRDTANPPENSRFAKSPEKKHARLSRRTQGSFARSMSYGIRD
jgi:hypothetical protein